MHLPTSPRRTTVGVAVLALVLLFLMTGSASAISRTEVMSRAQTWVDLDIEYSMWGWADDAGTIVDSPSLGWRRDCSGFTSMTWRLPKPGASSRTIQGYSTPITKEALQPGDAMVSYDNHVLVFGGWVDSSRTAYYAYEMSSSQSDATGDGTVMRITPYPYWGYNSTYRPYRLHGITGSIDYSQYTVPVAGQDRYETAIMASRAAFATGEASVVIIASGVNWPDALGASSLAGTCDAPILLTPPTRLLAAVAEEIERLGASEIIIVGSEAAISSEVEQSLASLPDVTTTRIGGADRYETARLIAAESVSRLEATGGTFDGVAFVSTGLNFPDALAASAFAADAGRPIVLTPPDRLCEEASATISSLEVAQAIMLGSEAALSSQVATDLASLLGSESVIRLGGATRYKTAMQIIDYCLPTSSLGYSGLAIASGQGFPDALAGGVMAARMGTFLGLTYTGYLDPGLATLMLEHSEEIGSSQVLGGESVIPSIVRESIALTLEEFEPASPPED